MTAKELVNKLKLLIDVHSSDFVTEDKIPEEVRERSKKRGFDDVIQLNGEDHNEIFLLHVEKI